MLTSFFADTKKILQRVNNLRISLASCFSEQLENAFLFTTKISPSGLGLGVRKTSRPSLLSASLNAAFRALQYKDAAVLPRYLLKKKKGSPRSICRCFRASLPVFLDFFSGKPVCETSPGKGTLLGRIFKQSLETTPQKFNLAAKVNPKIEVSLWIQTIPKNNLIFLLESLHF